MHEAKLRTPPEELEAAANALKDRLNSGVSIDEEDKDFKPNIVNSTVSFRVSYLFFFFFAIICFIFVVLLCVFFYVLGLYYFNGSSNRNICD